jgi:hypothetical protein
MTIADILIWQATNGLLLIPVVIALVILIRRARGQRAFTGRDWLFLIGKRNQKVFSLHIWLRFAVLWFAVVLMGFVEGYVLLPFAVVAFVGVGFLAALVVWRVAPKW